MLLGRIWDWFARVYGIRMEFELEDLKLFRRYRDRALFLKRFRPIEVDTRYTGHSYILYLECSQNAFETIAMLAGDRKYADELALDNVWDSV